MSDFEEWKDLARRDDCLDRMVPSDLRCILSRIEKQGDEIARLRALNAEMREVLNATLDSPLTSGKALKTTRLREQIRAAIKKASGQ